MIKRIAYVSTLISADNEVDIPSQLIEIINKARVFNKENGITGVLLFSDDSILQVLEGDSDVIARLMYKISFDVRHKDVSLILKSNTEFRLFEKWSMRLVSQDSRVYREVIYKLNQNCLKSFNFQQDLDSFRAAKFFDKSEFKISKSQHPNKNNNENNGKLFIESSNIKTKDSLNEFSFSMKAWPMPHELTITPVAVKVCSTLVGNYLSYSQLKLIHQDLSESKLLQLLTLLDERGLLTKTKSHGVARTEKVSSLNQSSPPEQSRRFSNILRKFISSNHRAGNI